MKKIITVAFLLMFIVSMVLPMQPAVRADSFVFSVGTVNAVEGQPQQVRVPISVSGNSAGSGFQAVALMVTFDREKLYLDRVLAPQPELPLNNPPVTPAQGNHYILLYNSDRDMIYDRNEDIAILVFDLLPGANTGVNPIESPITIAFTPRATRDGAPVRGTQPLSGTFSPGGVIIAATDGEGPGTSPGVSPSPGTSPDPNVSPSPGTSPGTGVSPSPGTSPGTGTSPSPGTSPGTGASPSPGTSPGTGQGGSGGEGGSGGSGSGFGNVPQTGVFISGTVAAMWLSIILTVFLSVCLYLYLQARRKPNKSINRYNKYGKHF